MPGSNCKRSTTATLNHSRRVRRPHLPDTAADSALFLINGLRSYAKSSKNSKWGELNSNSIKSDSETIPIVCGECRNASTGAYLAAYSYLQFRQEDVSQIKKSASSRRSRSHIDDILRTCAVDSRKCNLLARAEDIRRSLSGNEELRRLVLRVITKLDLGGNEKLARYRTMVFVCKDQETSASQPVAVISLPFHLELPDIWNYLSALITWILSPHLVHGSVESQLVICGTNSRTQTLISSSCL
ncbi:hypothetical protein CCUS01_02393 [Colletotrichum cuscutae]|uniref:Uncharacterized protein n=1 Tax=Colletotrichum cuscutae TaxID=1209917 RepID=A0AAI9TZJ0_9PEZI|nr:hypothetical protein CCUS01_02393 [Colletotrichum cuscutae]